MTRIPIPSTHEFYRRMATRHRDQHLAHAEAASIHLKHAEWYEARAVEAERLVSADMEPSHD